MITIPQHRARVKPKPNHPWKHGYAPDVYKSRTEPYGYWQAEGIDILIKKSVHKDNRGLRVKPL